MKLSFSMHFAAALTSILVSIIARAGSETDSIQCVKSGWLRAPVESADHRKYAPDRETDLLHMALDVTPDFQRREVSGLATFRLKPIAKPMAELRFDAERLNVTSVESSAKLRAWQSTGSKLILTFEKPVEPDQEFQVQVVYSAQPEQGLYFRTPEMGYKAGETHLFSQGEAIEARHWMPCFDSPNEKFTSEVTCRVPEGMTVISNGRKISEVKDPATGLVAVHWSQEKPHTTYLITLVAGYFKKVEDRYKDVPMAFYTLPSQINEAMGSFKDTKAMMQFFEEETGVPYPWAKYDQICVNDFVAGGMENTSATTLTDGTLFSAASENIRSSQGLVAHELAHQWFGDLVTCKDWSHLWLNEGFATYYAHLFDGHKNGRDHMLYGLYGDARGFLDVPNDTRPIVHRGYDKPMEMFGFLAYPKGSWILHMLRSQLGADLYKRCIRTYLERHQYGSVVTEDLNKIVEELSGRSFDQFFDQYVYHAHQPELGLTYSWDETSKTAKISVAQNQKLGEQVLLFRFPAVVRFKSKGKGMVIDRSIVVKEKQEDFYFSLPESPEIMRFDPDFTILAKVSFTPPGPMLKAQLADETDVIGRLLAVQAFSTQKDLEAVRLLKDRVQNDSFYGVRVEAAKGLLAIHSPEALDALMEVAAQSDARVRRQVALGVAGFYGESSRDFLIKTVEQEKNPDIVADALRGLGAYHSLDNKNLLLKHVNGDSYRNELAVAAVQAMRGQDDSELVKPLINALKERQSAFTSAGFASGLEVVGFLGRHESANEKEEAGEFLLGHVTHLKRRVRLGAINGLGVLGDGKAAAALETFVKSDREHPERTAAQAALESIRASKKPGVELQTLRTEFIELQRANKELKREFDELKKKVESRNDPAPKDGKAGKPEKPKKK